MSLVADGTVVVRDLDSGEVVSSADDTIESASDDADEEWTESVEVWEKHLIVGKTVGDAARQIAQQQAEPSVVETLEADLS